MAGFCSTLWPCLDWLHVGSDALIAAAYFSIPVALLVFMRRRRDLGIRWVFLLFAAFAVLCGATHLLSALAPWFPDTALAGGFRAVTAVVSVATAAVVWPLLPFALALPSRAEMATANRRLEAVAQERAQSEARYRFLYHHTPAPLHVLGLDGRIEAVSDCWLTLLGHERPDVIGRLFSEFCAPGQEGQQAAAMDVLSGGGNLVDTALGMQRRDGSILHVLLSATPEQGTDGQTARYLGVLADITEQLRAQDELRASGEKLLASQKLESIGRLTGGVAHDFNNMLAVITCGLESMRSKLPDGRPDLRRLADSCLEASFRSAKLTAQLLSFARRQALEPVALDPAEVVEGVRALLERTVGESTALVLFPPDPSSWFCLADRSQLESALLNLVLNAHDALPRGGTVSIRASNLRAGEPHPPGAQDELPPGEYVAVTVSDEGEGMSAQTLSHALEPFFTTKPMGRGTGLGLSQTYGFARQSNGTVAIESQEGVGTSVSLILPRAQPAQRMASGEGGEESPEGGTGTILIAEDEPAIRFVAEEILGELGYTVTSCPDGASALAHIMQGGRPTLLLTDIRMPGGLDGVELALRAREIVPDLPVLLCSGNDDGPDGRSRSVPGAALLRKPYRRADLALAVRLAIARSGG